MTEAEFAMPKLGPGTFRMTGAACQSAVESALAMGYRHIDSFAIRSSTTYCWIKRRC